MAAGAYTSVPDVLDYLQATIFALPACALPVVVSDGWIGTNQPPQFVSIGGGLEDDETSSLRDFAVLGHGSANLEESYEVPIYIRCWKGGTVTKGVRDQAFTIFKAIEAAIRADNNLGGAISRHYPARIGSLTFKQSGGPQGRAAEIQCFLSVRHRY